MNEGTPSYKEVQAMIHNVSPTKGGKGESAGEATGLTGGTNEDP